jgi:peptidyl-prolyl cis-trans isomerase NIMA-interacting 1
MIGSSHRSVLVMVSLGLAGCAGTSTPSEEAKPVATAGALSPGAACLANASRERTPKSEKDLPSLTLKQILVHHVESKNSKEGVTRSREDACLRAVEVRDKVIAGGDFDALITEYSDEAGAASRGGMVGSVKREDLVKPVADAAFALEINEMSDVVETPFGFHLLLRAP